MLANARLLPCIKNSLPAWMYSQMYPTAHPSHTANATSGSVSKERMQDRLNAQMPQRSRFFLRDEARTQGV